MITMDYSSHKIRITHRYREQKQTHRYREQTDGCCQRGGVRRIDKKGSEGNKKYKLLIKIK